MITLKKNKKGRAKCLHDVGSSVQLCVVSKGLCVTLNRTSRKALAEEVPLRQKSECRRIEPCCYLGENCSNQRKENVQRSWSRKLLGMFWEKQSDPCPCGRLSWKGDVGGELVNGVREQVRGRSPIWRRSVGSDWRIESREGPWSDSHFRRTTCLGSSVGRRFSEAKVETERWVLFL